MTLPVPLNETVNKKHFKDADGCWIWTGVVGSEGYGHITHKGRHWQAHRASWVVHRGEIPLGMYVLHKCDVRRCINPDHLFIGTHQDNMRDRNEKGRHWVPVGEKHHNSVLTSEQAKDIKTSHLPTATLMSMYRVSKTTVNKIRAGTAWKHLD